MNALVKFEYDAARTSLTLASGKSVDLLNPLPEDIDVQAVAEQLAKAARYCGATPGVFYSVAEHSVRGATAILLHTGNVLLAMYFLLHDWHEAFLGDDTTPKKRALAAIIKSFGVLAEHIDEAFAALTDRLDAAIHARFGLQWPPPPEIRDGITYWDRRMLATEWRDLMGVEPPYDFEVEPLEQRIVPDDWEQAMRVFLSQTRTLLIDQKQKQGQ